MIRRIYYALRNPSVPLGMGRVRHRLLKVWGNAPILVFTMGKVGSSTVVESLRNSRVSSLVYHIHFLSESSLDRIEQKYQRSGQPTPAGVKLRRLVSGDFDHLVASRILSPLNLRDSFVVTLVRDPLDTFFSHVFQNPQIHRPFLLGDDGKLSKAAVEQYVNEELSSFDEDEDFIASWFTKEFQHACGIDVYAHPFDADKGFSIIREGGWKIAVLATEKLNDCLAEAINELTGKQHIIEISNQNVRAETEEKEMYKELKAQLSFPIDKLQKVYSTRYAQHFFSKEHIQRAIEKWSDQGRVNDHGSSCDGPHRDVE